LIDPFGNRLLDFAVSVGADLSSVDVILNVAELMFYSVSDTRLLLASFFGIIENYVRVWKVGTSSFDFTTDRVLSLFRLRMGSAIHLQPDFALGNITFGSPGILSGPRQCFAGDSVAAFLQLPAAGFASSDRLYFMTLDHAK
jgi:hypothetical protein